VKNLAFVCTTTILYSRPNWYALVKSCINVNHHVLLVRRHLKYVWFTKFTKFWGEVKNGPSLRRHPKTKKTFSFRGQTPDQGLCPWTPLGGSAPRPPSVPPALNLPLHHWPCVMALQGQPRSLILALIESAYATSYRSSIVTLVLSCLVSEILKVSCWELSPTPIPPEF